MIVTLPTNSPVSSRDCISGDNSVAISELFLSSIRLTVNNLAPTLSRIPLSLASGENSLVVSDYVELLCADCNAMGRVLTVVRHTTLVGNRMDIVFISIPLTQVKDDLIKVLRRLMDFVETKILAFSILTDKFCQDYPPFEEDEIHFCSEEMFRAFSRIVAQRNSGRYRRTAPLKAPELWSGRNPQETAVEFIKRVYGPWMGVMERSDLSRLDRKLYLALAKWTKRHEHDAELVFAEKGSRRQGELKARGIVSAADAYKALAVETGEVKKRDAKRIYSTAIRAEQHKTARQTRLRKLSQG